MRTSASQFDALVSFMERHGDLNKIADGPQGRVRAIQLWEDLCNLLNLDVAGDSKSIDKWKKVWSDFKNNTKRKSAKIQAAGGTSATKLALSDLESRVLRLTGTSGNSSMMGAQDSGVEYVVPTNDWPGQNTLLVEKNLSSKSSTSDDDVKLHNLDRNLPGGSGQSTPIAWEMSVDGGSPIASPGRTGRSPRPGRVYCRTQRRGPGRRAPSRAADSDHRFRQMMRVFASEHLRLRRRELAQQAQWQNLFGKLVDVLNKFLNK
ncbi:uncharacterized protein LOC120630227 [Pararge aegeria]|uniref:uncharacterized protein LOC120630227 n=1 Tax=Pararge aegeria TaxID=116150 RepID=UPI0019D2F348|nr:uncharacterized protein LOC120630227 [Pararge aegeria]